ncbi:unnamed protein product, partial [Rotaria sordida]
MTKRNETNNGTHDRSEIRENMATVKKTDVRVVTNSNRKSNTEKSLHGDVQEKASDDPYVHEIKDFAGVTIIIRTVPNPKAFASLDIQTKVGAQAVRRKFDLPQSQSNKHETSDHGDIVDHS